MSATFEKIVEIRRKQMEGAFGAISASLQLGCYPSHERLISLLQEATASAVELREALVDQRSAEELIEKAEPKGILR